MITTLLLDATLYADNFSNTAVSYRDYILKHTVSPTFAHKHKHTASKCGINKFYCYKTFLFFRRTLSWCTGGSDAMAMHIPIQILVTTYFTQIVQSCDCLCCVCAERCLFTIIDETPKYDEASTFDYWFWNWKTEKWAW